MVKPHVFHFRGLLEISIEPEVMVRVPIVSNTGCTVQ